MPLYDFRCGDGHGFERFVPLADFHDAQHCDCGAIAHRIISPVRCISDAIEPTWGADGKQHTSLASYRNSLLPQNNPRGERFYELGNDTIKPDPVNERQLKHERAMAVKEGLADLRAGRVPEIVYGDEM